ncbi:MAG: hypothetical protein HY519_03410 [Candidatus Aenigmarchaeota archaeon]|nr:hypothetical protein [Candidatus Aenigmarchaeota archaeon]
MPHSAYSKPILTGLALAALAILLLPQLQQASAFFDSGVIELQAGEFLALPKNHSLLTNTANLYPAWGAIDGQNHAYYLTFSTDQTSQSYPTHEFRYRLAVFNKEQRRIVDRPILIRQSEIGPGMASGDDPAFLTGAEIDGMLYFQMVNPRLKFLGNHFDPAYMQGFFFKYDPATKTLARLNNLPFADPAGVNAFFPRSFLASDGTSLYAGVVTNAVLGYSSLFTYSFYQYDFGSDAWNFLGAGQSSVPLQSGIIGHTRNALVADNKIHWVANGPDWVHQGCVAMEFDLGTLQLRSQKVAGCNGNNLAMDYSLVPLGSKLLIYRYGLLHGGAGVIGLEIFSLDKATNVVTRWPPANNVHLWSQGIGEPFFIDGLNRLDGGKGTYLTGIGFDGSVICEVINTDVGSTAFVGGQVVVLRNPATLQVIGSTYTNYQMNLFNHGTLVTESGVFYFVYKSYEPGVNNYEIGIGRCGEMGAR